jgi:hypothetical protein
VDDNQFRYITKLQKKRKESPCKKGSMKFWKKNQTHTITSQEQSSKSGFSVVSGWQGKPTNE